MERNSLRFNITVNLFVEIMEFLRSGSLWTISVRKMSWKRFMMSVTERYLLIGSMETKSEKKTKEKQEKGY